MKELREEIEKILDSVGALATEFDENAKGFWIKYKTPEITDQILTLLEKEIQKAGINEVKKTDEKFSSLHQTTEGAGYVSYGEFGEYLDDRIKQLEKGEK